jgi:hypothetical protein
MDEDDDGRFPDDSLMLVRYPCTRQEELDDRLVMAVAPRLDSRSVRAGRMACVRRGP